MKTSFFLIVNLATTPKYQTTEKKDSKQSHENCQLCKEKRAAAKEQKRRNLKTEINRCKTRTISISEENE